MVNYQSYQHYLTIGLVRSTLQFQIFFFSVSWKGKKTSSNGGQLTDRATPIEFKKGQNLTLLPDWRNLDN